MGGEDLPGGRVGGDGSDDRSNQVGYYPLAPKIAIVTGVPATDRFFVVTAGGGDTAFTGRLGPLMASTNSSLSTRLADFTGLTNAGIYCMLVPGMERSYPFRIGNGILYPVVKAAMK